MADRLNVCVVSKYQSGGVEKSRWCKVGSAWPNKLGGWNVKLDFPVGAMELVLCEPKEREQGGGDSGGAPF